MGGATTLTLVSVVALVARAATAIVVAQPGYTDAYYYALVAARLARGQGLTADFVWNFIEAPGFRELPVDSHRFWMPLASVVQAIGIAVVGGPLGDFRAAQFAVIAVSAFIPVVTYAAARSLGATRSWAQVGAGVAGLGGAFAPAWVSLDAYGLAAVIGTLFFLGYGRAARGSVRWGLACGILTGLLYLARAEGALFGIALLALLRAERSRRPGTVASVAALCVGLVWIARNTLLGLPQDLVSRAVLLVRYEDFFALQPPTIAGLLAAPADVIAARAAGLATNAATAAMAVLVVLLVPLVAAARARWSLPAVRAFVGTAAAVCLAQSLLFTLHSVRGSFFHSLAAFLPFAIALAAAGATDLFSASPARMRRAVAATALAGYGLVSAFAVAEWDVAFNTPYRERLAVVGTLPAGPIVAADAAAWRWISGRPALVSPPEGPRSAACIAAVYGAGTLILEPAHFRSYDELYRTGRSSGFTPLRAHDGIRTFAIGPDAACTIAIAPPAPVPDIVTADDVR